MYANYNIHVQIIALYNHNIIQYEIPYYTYVYIYKLCAKLPFVYYTLDLHYYIKIYSTVYGWGWDTLKWPVHRSDGSSNFYKIGSWHSRT